MALLILFKFFKTKIWYVSIGLLAASVTTLIGNIVFTRMMTPDLFFDKKKVSMSKIKELRKNGVWQSVNSLGSTLNSGLDILITNKMLSLISMGQLSIAKTIGMLFSVLYTTISQAFQPRMLRAYASDNRQVFLHELQLEMRVSGFFSGCAFAGFLVLGKLFYQLWIPNQDVNLVYSLTVVTVLSSVADGVVFPTFYVNTLTT